jgi:hypothetical protein
MAMSNKTLSRRTFIRTSVAAGGGMLLGFHIPIAKAALTDAKPWNTPPGGTSRCGYLDKGDTVTIAFREMGRAA